jgi:hypothetical protein
MDSWRVRVGAETRQEKAGRQANIERVDAGHHSPRTSARTVRLLCTEELHVSARRQEGASGLKQNQRHANDTSICSASVRGLSASFILGEPCLRGPDYPHVGYDHPNRAQVGLNSGDYAWAAAGWPGVWRPFNLSSSSSSLEGKSIQRL